MTVTAGLDRVARRTRVGVVTSDKGDKTIRVEFHRIVKDSKYGKYVRRRTALHAHDPNNEAKTGDRVQVMVCRPVSKTKQWRLVKVLSRGDEA